MKEETVLVLVAMLCITILGGLFLFVYKIDGVILSGIVGAIVFLVTRQHYKPLIPAQSASGAS